MSYASGPHLQALYLSGWVLLVLALLLMVDAAAIRDKVCKHTELPGHLLRQARL